MKTPASFYRDATFHTAIPMVFFFFFFSSLAIYQNTSEWLHSEFVLHGSYTFKRDVNKWYYCQQEAEEGFGVESANVYKLHISTCT